MSILRNKYPYDSSNIYNVTASLFSDFPFLTPFEKIDKARTVVFNFDYPTPENIPHNDFKDFFETMFISKYFDNYFKYETFERWQVALYGKMLIILPVYNAKLSNFFEANKDKLFTNKTETTSESESNTENESASKNIASIFPANLNKAGQNIGAVNYANNGNISNDNSTANNKTTGTNTTISIDNFNNVLKFDEHFKGIFSELINEFNPLFSAVINY